MPASRIVGAIRPVTDEDYPELCALLNEIIAIGGTTALETRFTVSGFIDHFFNQQIQIGMLVAEGVDGELLGFQVLSFHEKLPDDWADIATFVSTSPRFSGVGTALFSETLELAAKYELTMLNAQVRADNVGGITYYEKMGFTVYHVEKDVPLKSGRLVDRVFMRRPVARLNPEEGDAPVIRDGHI